METEIDYSAVLADLKRRRDELDKAIVGIEAIIGFGPMGGNGTAQSAMSIDPAQPIPTDAFFGLSIVDAVKKFLNMRKRPQSTIDIAAALEAGGLVNQSGEFGNTVGSVLNRNAKSDNPVVIKVSRGMWGLKSWYGAKSKGANDTE